MLCSMHMPRYVYVYICVCLYCKCMYVIMCLGVSTTAKTAYKYGTQRNPSHSLDTGENGIRHNTVTDGNCILLVTCCHGNPWFT